MCQIFSTSREVGFPRESLLIPSCLLVSDDDETLFKLTSVCPTWLIIALHSFTNIDAA